MSDAKRKRLRKGKEDRRTPIILRRNDDPNSQKPADTENTPKILLKAKPEKDVKEDDRVNNYDPSIPNTSARTIIANRNETVTNVDGSATNVESNENEGVTLMTRPMPMVFPNGHICSKISKLLMKSNTDFFVIGVVGTQGVGKSTILNMLVDDDSDYYNKIFLEQDSVFKTKIKQNKNVFRSRTETTHLFITNDRVMVIDTPPVLCNSYKKDMVSNELDDLANIITLLSVCHLLIVVQDDYTNSNFIRLLLLAEFMKPSPDVKTNSREYFPNLLYVKNRAKREDFTPQNKENFNKMCRNFFKDSQMRIMLGQTVESHRQKKGRAVDADRTVNTFIFPEITGPKESTYHNCLSDLVNQLRAQVFMTPRNPFTTETIEMNEMKWFKMLTEVSHTTKHFSFKLYEGIHRRHHMNDGNSGNSNNFKDSHHSDKWMNSISDKRL